MDPSTQAINQSLTFFVGTYSDSIQLVEFNPATKSCSLKEKFTGVTNPSFLKHIPQDDILIAVKETAEDPTIFLIDLAKNSPTYGKIVQELPSHGAHPCHICYSPKNSLVFCSNYTGSTLSVFAYKAKRLELIETITYSTGVTGEKGNKKRQEAPHPHSVTLDSTETFAFVQDLGCDAIRIYSLESLSKPKLVREIVLHPGNGPRHLFNNNDRLYLANELSLSVSVFDFDSKAVNLIPVQEIQLIKDLSQIEESIAAEIKVFDDSIYVSVRGIDRMFQIPLSGSDKEIQNEQHFKQPSFPSGGKWPRNFNLTSEYLICGNQLSDNLVVFDRKTAQQICTFAVPSPAYIELLD